MFTGIITAIGTVMARNGGRMTIACDYDPQTIAEGASIACDGCCLTVAHAAAADGKAWLSVDVSNETLFRTTLGSWVPGRRINLERPLRLGEELGGHMVTGHIDSVVRLLERRKDGESVRFTVEAPPDLAPFLASKGSVALDGVSLTVNESGPDTFGVNIIPYTLAHTTWGDRTPGDLVNLEVDIIARYVERIASTRGRP